ncbi:hypothetical protein KJ567_00640, partial [Candidatus Bipolaricaulota bacterium]|nr:hypothetical protein [Candidatus Bipolaricaulota bacterium]
PMQLAAPPEFFSTYFSPNSEMEIPSLLIGDSAQVPVLLETHQLDPGLYTVRVEIDPATNANSAGRIAERNELNNLTLLQVLVLGADLAAANLISSYDGIAARGDAVDFAATVINVGVAPAGAFTVGFKISPAGDQFEPIRVWTCGQESPSECIGPEYFGYARLPGIDLLVPEAVRCSLDTSTLEPGEYIVRVEVDVDDSVPEHAELNNYIDVPLIITGDLPDGQDLPPGSEGPDLWIRQVNAVDVGGDAGVSNIWATITNLGDAASGPSHVAFFYAPEAGGDFIALGRVVLPPLLAGASTSSILRPVTSMWLPGTYDVRLVVDPDDEVPEINERNNSKDGTLLVR